MKWIGSLLWRLNEPVCLTVLYNGEGQSLIGYEF